MADLNVERKRTSVWVWVVALVVAALLIWALMELAGGGSAAGGRAPDGEVGVLDPPASSLAAGLRVT